MRVTFEATITPEGHAKPDDPKSVSARLKKMAGKRVWVTVERSKSKTLPQLGYFFSTVVPVWAEHAGYTEDEMYIALWREFFPKRSVVTFLSAETEMERPRISEATADEMSMFLDRCLREAAHQGLYIPSPKGE